MEDIIKLSIELKGKSTHVRKALDKFLHAWAEATSEELDDPVLETILIIPEHTYDDYVYFLTRGCRYIMEMNRTRYEHSSWEELASASVDLYGVEAKDLNMSRIRIFIKYLPEKLEEYQKKLQSCSKSYDKILDLLDKFAVPTNQEDS